MSWDDDDTGDYVPPHIPPRLWLFAALVMASLFLLAIVLKHPVS